MSHTKQMLTAGAVLAAAVLTPKALSTVHADEVTPTTPAPTAENTATTTESTATLKPQVDNAQAEVDTATKDVKAAEAENTQAQKDLKTAKQTAAESTPEVIQDVTADVNAATAAKPEAEKAVTDAEKAVADQTTATKEAEDAQKDAQTQKDTADKAVTDAKTAVTEAKKAADPKAQADAEKAVKDAQSEVIDAKTNVENAEKAVTDATAHDAGLADKIKDAEKDVTEKQTAVAETEKAQANAKADFEKAFSETSAARDALKKLQDTMDNANSEFKDFKINFVDPNTGETFEQLFRKYKETKVRLANEVHQGTRVLKHNDYNYEPEIIELNKQIFSLSANNSVYHATTADKNRPLDVTNITQDQQRELSEFAAYLLHLYKQAYYDQTMKGLSEDERAQQWIRKSLITDVTESSFKIAMDQVQGYKDRAAKYGWTVMQDHLGGSFAENLAPLWPATKYPTNMGEMKELIAKHIQRMTYNDAHSDYMHTTNQFGYGNEFALGVVYTPKSDKLPNGSFGITYIFNGNINPVNPIRYENPKAKDYIFEYQKHHMQGAPTADQLNAAKEALATATVTESVAKSKLATATATAAAAKDALTNAQNKLAEISKDNKQAEIATANLRIAQNALAQAEKKLTDAQNALKAVSSSKEEKAQALKTAQDNLATALATSQIAASKLADATAKFETESAKLASREAELTSAKAALAKLNETIGNLSDKLDKLKNADSNLAVAEQHAKDTAKALTDAQAALKTATDKLADLTARYNKAKDLEDLSKTLDITVDKDGTISGKPNVAPTEDALPEYKPETPKPITPSNKPANKPQGYVPETAPTVMKQTMATVQPSEKPASLSRVAARQLPNTGEEKSGLALLGATIFGALAGTGFRRRRASK